jgi:hypothetical protein
MPCNQRPDTHNLSDPTTKHSHTLPEAEAAITKGCKPKAAKKLWLAFIARWIVGLEAE